MVPWWIVVIIICIAFSGYMAFRAWKVEKNMEQQGIEREGQIYMERMKQERARRKRLPQ